MTTKTIIFLSIQALLAHAIFASCLGSGYNSAFGLTGSGYKGQGNLAGSNIVKTGMGAPLATVNGGGFTVTSSSPIAPSGVQVVSEYVIEGPLTVGGQLPVLSSVAVDGQLPTNGVAGTAYGCGTGKVAISEADLVSANVATLEAPAKSRSSKYACKY